MSRRKIVIMGAAGRDFHNFNVLFRDNADVEVVAFTATQIPDIDGRVYPPALAGPLYPDGIPIHPEERARASSSAATTSTRSGSPTRDVSHAVRDGQGVARQRLGRRASCSARPPAR